MNSRKICAALAVLTATLMVAGTTAASGPGAQDTKGKPTVVKRTVTEGRAFAEGQTLTTSTTTTILSDGSRTAETTTSAPTQAGLTKYQSEPHRLTTMADLDRYLANPRAYPNGPVATGAWTRGDPDSPPRKVEGKRAAAKFRVPAYVCSKTNDADGNDVHWTGCVAYEKRAYNAGKVIYTSKGKVSAWSDDGEHGDADCDDCDNITKVWIRSNLNSSRVYDWSPAETIVIEETCETTETEVEYKGITSKSSSTICPDKLSPYGLSSMSNGARWSGNSEVGDYRKAVFTGIQAYDGSGGEGFRIKTGISWA